MTHLSSLIKNRIEISQFYVRKYRTLCISWLQYRIFLQLAKRPAPPAYICEAAPRRGRFAPLASLAAAQRGSLRSRWLAGEVLRATQCINVARFARCLAADLGGQTASEVIFDLRIELLDLNNHKIDTHIATSKRPWPRRSNGLRGHF